MYKMFAYPKENRLLKKRDFDHLKINPKRFKLGNILLYYKSTRVESDATRLGFSISRKAGNAVQRNKIKRVIRDFFRRSKYKRLGLDINIVATKKIGNESEHFLNDFIGALETIYKGLNR